jgi:hypothetical protein
LSGLGQHQSGVPFFSNERVNEEEILAGHFHATRDRMAASGVLILMLHDTTEFTFHRNDVEPIGILHKTHLRKYEGRARLHRLRHSDALQPWR